MVIFISGDGFMPELARRICDQSDSPNDATTRAIAWSKSIQDWKYDVLAAVFCELFKRRQALTN